MKIKVFIVKMKIFIFRPKIINMWVNKSNNIGDFVCAPCLYFKGLKNRSISIDFYLFGKDIKLKNKTIVVGGGGLFCSFFYEKIENILQTSSSNDIIFWGVGFDKLSEEQRLFLDSNLPKARYVTIRDYYNNDKYEYIPCASCMSDLFDKYSNAPIKGKYCLYLYRCGIFKDIEESLPELDCIYNENDKSFEDIIAFLSSYEVILTNSFHGLYWATLLGKKVIVLPRHKNTFTAKFKTFKYKGYLLEDYANYKNVENLVSYPNALAECRQLNKEFFLKVKTFMDSKKL